MTGSYVVLLPLSTALQSGRTAEERLLAGVQKVAPKIISVKATPIETITGCR